MAVQIKLDELDGCESYLGWLENKSKIESAELARILFETDFTWSVKEDEIRAKDALLLRELYSRDVGKKNQKNEKEIDRIWKSIHGKCSVFELIIKMGSDLDSMLNEGEEGSMIPHFVNLMLKNGGWLALDDEDFDHRKEKTIAFWNNKTNRFILRKYDKNGKNGALFFVNEGLSEGVDFRKLPIWDQMNEWLESVLNDDGEYISDV